MVHVITHASFEDRKHFGRQPAAQAVRAERAKSYAEERCQGTRSGVPALEGRDTQVLQAKPLVQQQPLALAVGFRGRHLPPQAVPVGLVPL